MREPQVFNFSFKDLKIERSLPLRYMGYETDSEIPGPVHSALENLYLKVEGIDEIRGGYVIEEDIRLDRVKKQLSSNERLYNTGQIVFHQLKDAERLAWFLCTAGEDLSTFPGNFMSEGDMLSGYCADVLANVVVEAAMDRIQQHLKASMNKEGFQITNRYSPGYCEWNVSEQGKLFQVFPKDYLGISLTPSFMMKPVKTISGVIGIGREVRYNEYSCNFCADKNCVYRNKKSVHAT